MDPLYLIFTTIWLNSQLRSSIIFPVSLLPLLALYEGVVKQSRPCTFVLDINLPGVPPPAPPSPCHGHVGGPRPQCSKVFMKIKLGAVISPGELCAGMRRKGEPRASPVGSVWEQGGAVKARWAGTAPFSPSVPKSCAPNQWKSRLPRAPAVHLSPNRRLTCRRLGFTRRSSDAFMIPTLAVPFADRSSWRRERWIFWVGRTILFSTPMSKWRRWVSTPLQHGPRRPNGELQVFANTGE